MKKFLRLWMRHPVSITSMLVWAILGIWTRSFIPVVFGLVICSFLAIIWEIGIASYCLEMRFWRHLIEISKDK